MSFQEGSSTRSASTKRGLNPTVNIVWLVEAYSFRLAHGQWTGGNSHLIRHVASTIWVKLVWIPLLITNLNKRFTLLDFPAAKPPQSWKQSLSLATQPRTRHVICKFQDFFQGHLRWPIQGKRFSHLRDKSPRCPKLRDHQFVSQIFPNFQINDVNINNQNSETSGIETKLQTHLYICTFPWNITKTKGPAVQF